MKSTRQRIVNFLILGAVLFGLHALSEQGEHHYTRSSAAWSSLQASFSE